MPAASLTYLPDRANMDEQMRGQSREKAAESLTESSKATVRGLSGQR